jgi:hypothetical protein
MISERMRNGLRRLEMAFRGDSDYVPVTAQLAAHTIRLTGVDEQLFWSDPAVFLKNHLLASEYYELDGPSTYYDLYNIEAEALGQKLVWLPREFPEIDRRDQLIKGAADLDHLSPPDPYKAGRMPFVMEVFKRMVDMGLNPALRFCAPFSLAANIRGLSDLTMDILGQPEFAHRLFDFLTTEVLSPWIETLRKECGVKLPALGADALASLPITNPQIVEEFALAYALKMREQIGDVAIFGWWGDSYCPDPEVIFNFKLKASPGYFYGLDPDVKAIGPAKFKQFALAHNRPLLLGVDCQLIGSGPVAGIVARVKEYVTVGGRDDRLTLFLNAVPPECPSDHVHAAVQAAKFFSHRRYGEETASQDFTPQPRKPFREWLEAREK